MEKKYKILQIGPEDWRDTLALPAQLDWYHVPPNTPSAIQKIMDEKIWITFMLSFSRMGLI